LIFGIFFFDCGQTTSSSYSLYFTGITRTTANGDIIEDDPEDWQPRTGVSIEPLTVSPAYPNPTNRSFTLRFYLDHSMNMNITVNNTPTNVVLVVQNNKHCVAGVHSLHVHLRDMDPAIYRVYFEGTTYSGNTYTSFGDIQLIE